MQKEVNISRVQSPSSINTYKQCPRKYYYRYLLNLPTLPSIHLARGKITHSVLEDFFSIEVSSLSNENFLFELNIIMHEIFKKYWKDHLPKLRMFDLSQVQLDFYNQETMEMLDGWFDDFKSKIIEKSKTTTIKDAFKSLIPEREVQYLNEEYGVQGYIDAIYRSDNEVILMDYKTSKKKHISDEYYLQLAIYAFLYKLKHKQLPTKVGIHFLKHGEELIDADESLVNYAQEEVELIHIKTESKDMADYPKKPSPLCKWATGQCDYYDICFKQKRIDEF